MPLPSYHEMTETLGVPRCRGIQNGFRCYDEHERGEIKDGFLHWRDRREQREGIYQFLKLAAEFQLRADPTFMAQPLWAQRYQILRFIPVLAAKVRVQLPRKLGDRDRVELAAMLVNVPTSLLGRNEALEWARR